MEKELKNEVYEDETMEDTSTCSSNSSFLSKDEMPLLKYGRLKSGITSHKFSASALGKGSCNPSTLSSNNSKSYSSTSSTPSDSFLPSLADYSFSEKSMDVLALGYETGDIYLMDLNVGGMLVSKSLDLSPEKKKNPSNEF